MIDFSVQDTSHFRDVEAAVSMYIARDQAMGAAIPGISFDESARDIAAGPGGGKEANTDISLT